jgi:hypothetical protein
VNDSERIESPDGTSAAVQMFIFGVGKEHTHTEESREEPIVTSDQVGKGKHVSSSEWNESMSRAKFDGHNSDSASPATGIILQN